MRALARLMLAGFIAASAFAGGAFAGGKGTEVTIDNFKSVTPAEWKSETPGNKFRAYQFTVPKASGDAKDAEVVIFFFGAGSGGSVDENIGRWKKMFVPPQGKSIDDVAKVDTLKVGPASLTYLDVAGTYVFKNPPFDPKAKEERHADYRMLSVYFASENGPYFIRMTGPAKTVEQNKKKFDDWLKSFK